jgi:hypothetical protein
MLLNERGSGAVKVRFDSSAASRHGCPPCSSWLFNTPSDDNFIHHLTPAKCVFEVLLRSPHDIPCVRQHLHDFIRNSCHASHRQSVRIDLEQKPHGTQYRIHVCLSNSEEFTALNQDLALAIQKVVGVSPDPGLNVRSADRNTSADAVCV